MDKDHKLGEPTIAYGNKIKLSEAVFTSVPNAKETLLAQGYVTFEEFVKGINIK